MDCNETKRLLTAYVDGELELTRQLDMEAHLAACSTCKNAAEAAINFRYSIRVNMPVYKAPMSPITMTLSSIPGVKAAQEVNPIKGASRTCSTEIATSFRGLLTLKVFSFSFSTPLRPVTDSILAVSRPLSAARPSDAGKKRRTAQRLTVPTIISQGKD
jgi:hypothetical protein